ncbi:caspase-3 [Lingula anatina]|uniref:Caspase-3 n=1 Tax=Lingula anatina TaxID=7574 RepID=A0A1S3JMN6_LINAN|nr:caspase-3 [Lingula anatina]|eukprot:XP_013411650.1 caspase-3 [Lingula anatina]
MDDTETDTPPSRGGFVDLGKDKRPDKQVAHVRAGPENEYPMDYRYMGKAIIFNIMEFKGSGIKRKDVDAAKLYGKLEDLKFQVSLKNNFSAEEIKDCLARVAKENHQDMACFMCIILTRGREGLILGKDRSIPVEELLQPFKGNKCPSLAGKPKIFLIQADQDITFEKESADFFPLGTKYKPEETKKYRIPAEADFLVATSVIPGKWSWDITLPTASHFKKYKNASCFIHHLCEMLEKESEQEEESERLDLLTLFMRVSQLATCDVQQALGDTHKALFEEYDLIPCVTSTLTKDIIFPISD